MLNQEDLRSDVESCSVGVEARRPSLYKQLTLADVLCLRDPSLEPEHVMNLLAANIFCYKQLRQVKNVTAFQNNPDRNGRRNTSSRKTDSGRKSNCCHTCAIAKRRKNRAAKRTVITPVCLPKG